VERRGGFIRRFYTRIPTFEAEAKGCEVRKMDWTIIVSGGLASGLFVYLVVALLRPEKF
jgi:K+-transporting ATPase KdpF subunit